LGQISQITETALSQTPGFSTALEDSKIIAKGSIDKIIQASLRSVLIDEIVFALFYQMNTITNSDNFTLEDEKSDFVITELTKEDIDNALSKVNLLEIARSVWEIVMKFVGFTHEYENSQFKEYFDPTLFGIDGDDVIDFPFNFGWTITSPF
jgi:hypothetical protein